MVSRGVGLRILRAVLVGWVAVFVTWRMAATADDHSPLTTTEGIDDLSLDDARHLFPAADALGGVHAGWGGLHVVDGAGDPIGVVLRTSPVSDAIHGYAGLADVALGVDPEGRVVGAVLRSSADTPEYVESVRQDTRFWRGFAGIEAGAELSIDSVGVDSVSGATLTCTAIVESVAHRLRGRHRNLRFPRAIDLAEVREVVPAADRLEPDGRVFDPGGEVIAVAVRTSPYADNLRGYAGPSDCLVILAPDRTRILGVRLRASFDSPDYAERVRADAGFFDELKRISAGEFEGIEGVSGATQTSYAMAEGIRLRMAALANAEAERSGGPARAAWIVLLTIGGVLLVFRRGHRRLRRIWQVLVVGVLGCWLGDLLSLGSVAAMLRSGSDWLGGGQLTLGGAWIGASALAMFVIPWSTGRQPYCAQLCPHGAVQEWIGSIRRWRRPFGRRRHRVLTRLPGALLLGVVLVVMLGSPGSTWSLASVEPFGAWSLWWAAPVSLTLLVVGWLLCLRTPMAYCRYGCPTGALLGYVRARPGRETWRGVDSMALVVAILAAACTLWSPLPGGSTMQRPSGEDEARLVGRVCGERFSVEAGAVPAAARRALLAEARRLEQVFWDGNPQSERSEFDRWQTTRAVEVGAELFDLVAGLPQPDLVLDPEQRTLRKGDPAARIALPPRALRDHVVERLLEVWRDLGAGPVRIALGGTVRVMDRSSKADRR